LALLVRGRASLPRPVMTRGLRSRSLACLRCRQAGPVAAGAILTRPNRPGPEETGPGNTVTRSRFFRFATTMATTRRRPTSKISSSGKALTRPRFFRVHWQDRIASVFVPLLRECLKDAPSQNLREPRGIEFMPVFPQEHRHIFWTALLALSAYPLRDNRPAEPLCTGHRARSGFRIRMPLGSTV
jgi:hypothetical protein